MRPVMRVHRSGAVYIAASIILGVLSINSGNNFHYLAAAAMLGFMLASGLAGLANINSAEISLDFPDDMYAGIPFLLTVEVRNRSRRKPLYLIELQIDEKLLMFPVVAPDKTSRMSIAFSFPKRGKQEIKKILLFSVFPFNFFTRYRSIDGDLSCVVFPAPLHPSGEQVFLQGGCESINARTALINAEEDIVGVRPYIEGDKMRQIHWKSSARTGKLSTRIYDDAAAGGEKIVDLEGLMFGGKERALSVAAYAVKEAILTGDAIGMRDGVSFFPVSAVRRDKLMLLERLALYE